MEPQRVPFVYHQAVEAEDNCSLSCGQTPVEDSPSSTYTEDKRYHIASELYNLRHRKDP